MELILGFLANVISGIVSDVTVYLIGKAIDKHKREDL